jgi:hypothetical protein
VVSTLLLILRMKTMVLGLFIFFNLAISLQSRAAADSLSTQAAQVQARLEFLANKKSTVEGPNCWNESTFVAGISKGLHHTSFSEFAFILDSPLCQQVTMDQALTGDIVAFRRFDRSGHILPASILSEVHGYTFVDSKMGFTKNGVMVQAPYEMMSHDDIYKFYRKSEYNNCKMFGFERGECNMKVLAYHCQSIEGYLSAKGELSMQEQAVLAAVGRVEARIQKMVLSGEPLVLSQRDDIPQIRERISELESLGSSEFLIDYLSLRVDSIVQTQSP